MRTGLLAVLLLACPATASEQDAACASVSDANLPSAFAGWAEQGAALNAGASAADAPSLEPGRGAAITLYPLRDVQPSVPPGQMRIPEDAHGGLVRFTVPVEGTWRVAASMPVWIDVVSGARRVEASGHGRMAACTTIRKVVEFPLTPGTYILQLFGNPGPGLRVMVSRKP